MKIHSPFRLLLSALLTLVLSHVAAFAQQGVYNPTPDSCCSCLSFEVQNYSALPGEDSSTVQASTTGEKQIVVVIKHTGASGCATPLSGKVGAISKPGAETLAEQNFTVSANQKVELTFNVPTDLQRVDTLWQFYLTCAGSDTACLWRNVHMNSCNSCSSGSCPITAEPSAEGESFEASFPTSSVAGGMASGRLRYYTKDFSYAGRAGLFADLPSDFTVVRDGGGLITQIIHTFTGAVLMELADVVGEQAFTVVNKTPSGTVFRTSKLSFVNEGGANRLRLDTTFDGVTRRHEQTQPQAGTLVMERGSLDSEGNFVPLIRETLVKTTPNPGVEVRRRTVSERASASYSWFTSSEVEETWENFVNGWFQTKEIIDPTGAALTTIWTYYQPGEITGPGASTEGLGRIKSRTSYDGSAAFYTYALNYQAVTTPYAGNSTGKVTVQTYDPGSKTQTTTTTVNGQLISKTVTVHTSTSETQTVYTSASGTLTTVTHYNPSGQDFGGKPIRTLHSDGTLTTYAYTRNAGGGYTTTMENGATSDGTSVSQGMRSISTTNSRGTTILSKTEAIGYGPANGLVYDLMAVTEVDNLGRATTTAYHPTSATITGEFASASSPAWTTETEYSCCGIASQTDKYGITTFYAYDGLQRPIKSNTLGVTTETVRTGGLDTEGKPQVITETYRYAQTITESLTPSFGGTSASLISRSIRNLSGTKSSSESPDPTSTSNGALVKSSSSVTTYQPAAGLSSRTVTTTADNFSQTTDSFLDGRTATTYGDLSPAMQYAYTVNSTGEVTSQSYVDGTNLRETTTTQSDWAGRTLRVDYMDGAFATMEYNSLGQMVKSTDPDGVVTLMRYNTEGEQTITAIDLNRNGDIEYGSDTVQFSDTDPAIGTIKDASGNDVTGAVWKTTSSIWQPGDNEFGDATVVSTSLRSANGLLSSSQSLGVDFPSRSQTVLLGNGNWTTTSISPDGTKSVSTYTDGRLAISSSLDTSNSALGTQTYGYDSLNRPVTTTDARTGASTTNYLSLTADIVASVSDPAGRTTAFTYDIRGRQISVDAPDTPVDESNPTGPKYDNVTNTIYNPDNTVAETNGDQTYRVSHTYDYADRQISMTTYGTETATTTWQYSPTRGFLEAKRDAANKGADYTYTPAGRLATRTWGRSLVALPKATEYSYDNGGRLISTNYTDTTPDVTITYDSMGRQTTQTNGVATSTFAYNPANLQLDTETIAYNLDGQPGTDFTRVIDRSQDNLGRESGWQLKDGTTIENDVQYLFGTTDGRLATVRRGDIPVPQEFSYAYTPNSSLIATVTSPAHIVSNVYEPDRDVLASKVNKKLDTTTVSSYFYTVNNYGQRTGVTTGGTAFSGTPSWLWGYNNKGEIVKADSSEAAFDRAYQYDGIGNRLKTADSLTLPTQNNYTPNALNQYSSITNPQSTILNPSYDADGNMTSGPLPANVNANSTLTWDGENRLIQAQVTSGATVSYIYDSQSRRIAETVGSATTVYIYDGWNPIAEYNTTFALTKTYIWGLDLSGSMQGAGGVGGLLAVTDGSGTYYPTYDGNGNVSEYLDSTGATVAHYEYDPFGKTVVATGSKANDFSHRFSTKPLDLTTGLYYYGYRWYDPETGRWPSRDPIEEEGGINLYGFVGNNGVDRVDRFGLNKYNYTIKASVRGFYERWDLWSGPSGGGQRIVYREYNSITEYGSISHQVSFECQGNRVVEAQKSIAASINYSGGSIANHVTSPYYVMVGGSAPGLPDAMRVKTLAWLHPKKYTGQKHLELFGEHDWYYGELAERNGGGTYYDLIVKGGAAYSRDPKELSKAQKWILGVVGKVTGLDNGLVAPFWKVIDDAAKESYKFSYTGAYAHKYRICCKDGKADITYKGGSKFDNSPNLSLTLSSDLQTSN